MLDNKWRVFLVATLLLGMMGTVSAGSSVLDDFEDGDISEYDGQTGAFSVTSQNVFSGSQSLEKTVSNYAVIYNKTFNPNNGNLPDPVNITARVYYNGNSKARMGPGFFDSADGGGYNLEIDTNGPYITIRESSDATSYTTSKTVQVSSFSQGWYRLVFQKDGSTYKGWVYDTSSNSLVDTITYTDTTESPDTFGVFGYDSSTYLDLIEMNNINLPPSIDSVSTQPSSWTLGSQINVSANVSDSDGTVSSVVADVWENGTQIVNDATLSDSDGDGVWEVSNLFTVDESNVYYNVSVTATDNDGASTSKEFSQLIKNLPPKIAHFKPSNNSDVFTYTPEYEIRIRDDGDNVPSENISCTLYSNGDSFRSVWALENMSQAERTFSGQLSEDVGQNKFKTSCVDRTVTNTTTSYQTRYSKIKAVYSPSPVYETENRTFELDLKTGDMVNSAEFSLSYGGAVKDTKSLSSNGVETLRPNLYHEISLVDNNQTTKNWRIKYDLNISDFGNTTTSTIQRNTSQQSQQVLWSYWIKSADTNPANGKYIETENLKHEVEIGTETKKAELSGTTQYSRNSETDKMTVTENTSSSTTLQGNIDVGQADNFNQSIFQTSSNIQIQFNGQTRTLSTAQDNVEVYRIQLFGQANPGSLTTSKALKFDIQYEETGAEVKTRLTLDLSVWKNKDELIRRFKFNKNPAGSHSFYVYPAWASYKIRTLPYPEQTKFDLIQYWNDNKNYVRRSYFFPTTQTINKQTTTIPLRTINRSEATKIDFEILNSEGSPAQNVYCRVDRKFGGGSFSTVFMIKTGSQGRGQSFAEVNEIYYSFTCYKNGEVIETFPSQIMQNPMVLTLGQQQVQTVLDYNNVFDAACTSNTTQISCDYQSQTEKMREAQLTVERLEAVQNVQVCSKTSSTITGELACNQLNTTENDYRYTVEGVYPGATITGAAGQTGVNNSGLGAGGLILTIFIFMFVYAATSFNVPLGIAAGTFTLLLTETVGLWVLTPTMRASLIAVALIAGLVTRR